MDENLSSSIGKILIESVNEIVASNSKSIVNTEYRVAKVVSVSGSRAVIKFDTIELTNVFIKTGVSIVNGDNVRIIIENKNLDRCTVDRKL